MVHVTFTQSIQHHVPAPPREVAGATVRDALEQVFAQEPRLRGYVLDDQGELRKHVVVFVDGMQIEDRVTLRDRLAPSARIHVMQALSGG